ncbi:hypothetical protein A2U01_0071988 [Trifolium medium]|uniref:Uncharacterized protein n=1 Tax=Trifolium medium TaxID=97028 RepID=A0A392SRA3_9FABA|nr:hypothetical protein [Trifolium medium]
MVLKPPPNALFCVMVAGRGSGDGVASCRQRSPA